MSAGAALIRRLEERDLPVVASIHSEGWQTAYAGFMDAAFLATRTPAHDEAWLRKWMYDRPQPLGGHVAEIDGAIAGFTVAGPNTGIPYEYDSELFKLFVRPAYQGRGLGRVLFNTALDDLRWQGFKRVCIWTFAGARSGEFYRKLGYDVVLQHHETFGGTVYLIDIYGGTL